MIKRTPSKLIIVFIFLFNISIYCETISGKVIVVSDGDTITILDKSSIQYKVRFEHIDAPEKGQAFGQKSKEFISQLIFGKTVKIKTEIKDRYGRHIGSVYLDEKFINLELVKAGLAWHYKKYSKSQEFSNAEKIAKANKAGLWKEPHPVPPWDYRKLKQK